MKRLSYSPMTKKIIEELRIASERKTANKVKLKRKKIIEHSKCTRADEIPRLRL